MASPSLVVCTVYALLFRFRVRFSLCQQEYLPVSFILLRKFAFCANRFFFYSIVLAERWLKSINTRVWTYPVPSWLFKLTKLKPFKDFFGLLGSNNQTRKQNKYNAITQYASVYYIVYIYIVSPNIFIGIFVLSAVGYFLRILPKITTNIHGISYVLCGFWQETI